MNFRGGIYISQVQSMQLNDAIGTWAKNLDLKEIQHFGRSSREELIKSIESNDDYPTQLTGMDNVWGLSWSLKTGFVLVNIVVS